MFKNLSKEDYEKYMNELDKMNARMKKTIEILNQIEDEDALIIINGLLMRMQEKLDFYKLKEEGDNNE